MADRLQAHKHPFHTLQYGSSKQRSAIYAMMLTVSIPQREKHRRNMMTLLGKKIVSAFKIVQKHRLVAILKEKGLHAEAEFYGVVLETRKLQISSDAVVRGKVEMTDGSPQGSPL